MNKSILWLFGLLFVASSALVSCSETDGVEDPYANWEERNQKYIDSIAVVAKAAQGTEPGQWKIIRSYKLPPLNLGQEGDVNDYVYCKILKAGDGVTPLFTDTVGVNYRGEMINGTVFDQSYTGELKPGLAIPAKFALNSNLITGWPTVLQQMKVGDRWMVYIPADLGYGASTTSGIPGYSTLIFDIDLDDVYPLKSNGRSVDLEVENTK